MHLKYLTIATGLVAVRIDYRLIHDIFDGVRHYIEIGFQPDAPTLRKRLELAFDAITPALKKTLFSIRKVPSQVLDPPMYIKHGTPEEARLYMNNALASNCFQNSFLKERCTCRKTYADIELIQNEQDSGTVTVSANKRFKQIVVSYRGSASIQNALDNIDFVLVDLPGAPDGVKVHRGFYKIYLLTYNKVREAVKRKLHNPEYKDYVVHLTGLSLGGAVSIISIPNLHDLIKSIDPNRKIQVFTYMSPRPGNIDFARYVASFDVPITRHVHANDVVPHLAPRTTGAVHVGQEIFTPLGTNQTIVCSQKYDEDPECGDRFAIKDLQASSHLRPFGEKIPYPPYC